MSTFFFLQHILPPPWSFICLHYKRLGFFAALGWVKSFFCCLLIAFDNTKLCFRPSAFVGRVPQKPQTLCFNIPQPPDIIKTDTTAKKHEELKCAEKGQRETKLMTKKTFFFLFFTYSFYTFICYLITRRCCCLNKIIAVHDVRLISSE